MNEKLVGRTVMGKGGGRQGLTEAGRYPATSKIYGREVKLIYTRKQCIKPLFPERPILRLLSSRPV